MKNDDYTQRQPVRRLKNGVFDEETVKTSLSNPAQDRENRSTSVCNGNCSQFPRPPNLVNDDPVLDLEEEELANLENVEDEDLEDEDLEDDEVDIILFDPNNSAVFSSHDPRFPVPHHS